jgi:hypothetical protein
VQLPFSAEGIDDPIDDNRNRARPFVETEVVAVGRRITVLPLRLAVPGLERLDHFAIADAVEKDHAVADDDRTAEALTDLL